MPEMCRHVKFAFFPANVLFIMTKYVPAYFNLKNLRLIKSSLTAASGGSIGPTFRRMTIPITRHLMISDIE